MGFPLACRLVLLAAGAAFVLSGCSDDKAEAKSHLDKAATYLANHDTRAAVLELKSALQLDPDNADGRLTLGRVYLTQGLGAAARKELDRARQLGSKDGQLALDLVKAMLLDRAWQDALDVVGTDGQDTAPWKVEQGNALLGLGKLDEARASFERALELDAASTEARRGLARLDVAGGNAESALGQVDKALQDNAQEVQTWLLKGELELSLRRLEASEASFRKVLELIPDLPAGQLGLVRVLLAQSRTDEASPLLRELEARKIKDPLLYYLKAVEARQRNDLDKAQEALREVLRVAPDHAPSQLLMGQIHLLKRELDQAKSMLTSYVAKVPGDPAGRKLLAATLVELNEPAEAVKVLAPVEQATPDDAQTLSLLGTAYMKMHDFDKSREYMDRAAKQAPDTPAIRTQLAVSHLASGDTAQAASELEAVIEKDPQFQRADFLLVLTRLRAGDNDAALAAARKLVDKHPDSAEAHNLLGAVFETRKELDKARAEYERSASLSDKARAAELNLARLDMIGGHADEAKARFEGVLKQHPDEDTALMGLAKIANDGGDTATSLELLERARRANPDAVRPRLVLADYYLRRGQAATALPIAEEAARQAPDSPAVMLTLGRCQLASGQPALAEETLSTLASSHAKSPLAHLNLALAQVAAGHPDAARGSLERTLELQPDNHLARATLGRLLLRAGAYDQALAVADRLAKDLPAAPAAEVLRGDVFQAQGKTQDALAAYTRAMDKEPSSALVLKLIIAEQRAGLGEQAERRARSWLESHPDDGAVRSVMAAATQMSGDDAKAAGEYERVLETSPRNVVALNNLAWLYDKKGDPRALELAKRAYDLLPQRPEVADTYGWLLVKSGQVEQGLAIIEKALEAAPDNADIRFHQAAALDRAGEPERAADKLEALLKEAASFGERDKAEALLAKIKGG